jgi:hypothetical protein
MAPGNVVRNVREVTMSDEERPRESAPNPTQQRMDEEGTEGAPVDASWDEDDWGSTDTSGLDDSETERVPHEGEEGQAGDVA